MESLLALLDENEPNEKLMKDELLGELARFAQAIVILNVLSDRELENARSQIARLASSGSTELARIVNSRGHS
jgi:hypothetical protein